MLSESLPRNFILVLCSTTVLLTIFIILYTQEQFRQHIEILESERMITIQQVVSRAELRIDDATKILESMSKDERMMNHPYVSSIDIHIHGIPQDLDQEKRTIFHNTLEIYKNFEDLGYILPNGDIYLVEPYSLQKASTVSNISFRDYFKAITKTHEAYVSPILISKASSNPVSVIASPVLSENGTLIGILLAPLDLNIIHQKLQKMRSYPDERLLMVDNNMNLVADSVQSGSEGKQVSLGLEVISSALSGKNGTAIVTVNGTKMFVAYIPMKAGQNTWTVISMQPYDEAFRSPIATIRGSIILVTIIIGISSGSIYTANKLFKMQFRLRKQVEDSNVFLKKTQSLLLESEEKFRNLFNLSPDAILVFDKNESIVSYNESFKDLFGYSEVELVGKSVFVIVKDDKLDLAHSYFDEILKTGFIKNKENWLKRKDGTVFPAMFSVRSLTDKNNLTIGYIFVIKDITDMKAVQEKLNESYLIIAKQLENLKEVERLKDEFAAMVSHELKTPLFPIKFHSETLKDPILFGTLNPKQMEAVKSIYQSALILERLIDDILTSQKLEMHKLQFDINSIELDKFMQEVVQLNSSLMEEKKIDFVNSNKEKWILKSDPNRLHQVFTNMIRNSVDFVPDKNGRIEIGSHSDVNDIVFYVKDNGIGIPKEKQKNLFKKFYQIDTSFKRKHGGTGLGLTICKGIVEGLGGKIWIESDANAGVSFYFSMPKEYQQKQ